MAYFNECPYCGANNDPGETCLCSKQRKILLTFTDGDNLITRINGTDEEILAYYGLNNLMTFTGDEEFRDRDDSAVSSIKFLDTGRVVQYHQNQEVLNVLRN